MKQKQNFNRSITVPIQLVVQSNDYPFISSGFIKKDQFDLVFKKLDAGPAKILKIDKNGRLISVLGIPKYDKENKQKTAQEIIVYHVNEQGLYLDTQDLQRQPAKFYTRLSKLRTDKSLSNFVRETGFCDFPVKEEEIKEKKYYLKKFVPTETGTRARNWLILYRKLSALSQIIENASKKEITKQDVDYLMAQKKQNVLEITFGKEDFADKELKDPDIHFKKNDFLKQFTPQEIRKGGINTGYRVFGHVALCCLELLTDILKSELPRFCGNSDCRRLLPSDTHGNRKYCNPSMNPRCYQQWRSAEKKKERRKIKLRSTNKRKSLPKRNLI